MVPDVFMTVGVLTSVSGRLNIQTQDVETKKNDG